MRSNFQCAMEMGSREKQRRNLDIEILEEWILEAPCQGGSESKI